MCLVRLCRGPVDLSTPGVKLINKRRTRKFPHPTNATYPHHNWRLLVTSSFFLNQRISLTYIITMIYDHTIMMIYPSRYGRLVLTQRMPYTHITTEDLSSYVVSFPVRRVNFQHFTDLLQIVNYRFVFRHLNTKRNRNKTQTRQLLLARKPFSRWPWKIIMVTH